MLVSFGSILRYRGLIASSGTLELTADLVRFTPSGWLDRVTGVGQIWEVPLPSIDRILLEGRIDRRLLIGKGEEEHLFGGRRLDECLLALIRGRAAADEQSEASRRELRGVDLLERWTKALGLGENAGATVRACELGMLQGNWRGARWGWLVVHEGLRFLPVGPSRRSEEAWFIRAEALDPPEYDDDGRLPLPGDRVFFPSLGELALHRLRSAWRALRADRPMVGGEINRRATYRSRPTVPPAVSVRIPAPEPLPAEAAAAPPGALSAEEAGPAAYLLATTEAPQGVVDAAAAGPPPEAPADEGADPPERTHEEVLSATGTVERVVRGELRDLSIGGACIAVMEEIPAKAELFLEIPGLLPGGEFHGVVLHSREVSGPHVQGHYWLVGVKFEGLLAPEENSIARLVMWFQRTELAPRRS